MINTIIVEDNLYVQKHFASVFTADGRFDVICSLRDAFEAEALCGERQVDLVLMDVQTLHNHSGLAAGKRIRALSPKTKVVTVTSLVDPEILSAAKQGGADSLWYKDHGDADIMDVIERTLAGEHIFPDVAPAVDINGISSDKISPRQLDILRRFVMGMTYEEIARDLKLTKNGVRWNLDRIVETCGFKNKHELLAAAIENKLIVTTLKD